MVKKNQPIKPSSNDSEQASTESDTEKTKSEIDIDVEEFDLQDEFINFPTENEKAAKKMAARRKIEMYWEKKRLQEQLGDIDDLDLDF